MKKLLNTLYVSTEGASVRKDGQNAVVLIDGEERSRVPLHMLSAVVAFGPISLSPAFLGAAARAGITVSLLDRVGRFEARVEGPVTGNVLLRRAQYRASQEPTGIVRSIVLGKIANQRSVLMRALRDHGDGIAPDERANVAVAIERLATIVRRVDRSDVSADQIRGSEGEAAALYFSRFGHMIRHNDPAFAWKGRSRRPPLDPVNALLSLFYTLLTHDCRSAAESIGLDPQVGFLHRDRPGRPSLALDLMEEMRPVLADRLVLSLINRRQLSARDFVTAENGAVSLTDEGRRTAISLWQERKRHERVHPFLGETAPLGLVPYLQAQLLSRHLRGDLDAYPPWFWK
ncbi:MAG: type I-C CRISPR-associated endonuclease Cas1c [Devosia sp.]